MQTAQIHKQATILQLNSNGQNIKKNAIKKPIVTLISFTLQLIIITIDSYTHWESGVNWIELNEMRKKHTTITKTSTTERILYAKNIPAFYGYHKILSSCNQTGWNSFFQLKLMTNAHGSYTITEHNSNWNGSKWFYLQQKTLRNNWNYDAFEFVYWNAHYYWLMFMTYVNENKWYNFELNCISYI